VHGRLWLHLAIFSANAQVLYLMKNKKIKSDYKAYRKILVPFLILSVLTVAFFFLGKIRKEKEVSSIDFSTDLENRINKMVSGYPIEEMSPYISEQDRTTAAFLVAIAKKESNWGKISPQKNGKTCYNYWGYRGTYNQTDSGYSCFDSPQQAISVVGKRIGELIDKKIDSPKKMVVAWKCGFDCSTHSFFSVKKWEWDVGFYFDRVYH